MSVSNFIKRKINFRIRVALLCIGLFAAVLTTFSHFLINSSSKSLNLINLTTQQQMLAQQIMLQQDLIYFANKTDNTQEVKQQVKKLSALNDSVERNHLDIVSTLPEKNTRSFLLDEHNKIYYSGTPSVDEITREFIKNSRLFTQDFKLGKVPTPILEENRVELLAHFSKADLEFQIVADKQTGLLVNFEWLYLTITVALLLIFAVFISKSVEILLERAIKSSRKAKSTVSNAESTSDIQSHLLTNNRRELRTHISSIFGMIELAQQESDKVTQKNLLQKAQIAGRQLLLLIDNLQDIAQIENDKLQIEKIDFELPKLLDDCLAPASFICEQNGVAFRYEALSPLPSVAVGDPVHLCQVINNLVNNAINFTHYGSIKTSADIRVKNKTLMFEFTIEDTGVGIGEDDLARVFEKFTQLKNKESLIYNGSGLGLTIAKALVEKMGGTITLRSSIGKGTIFKFAVPLAKSDRSASAIEFTLNTKIQANKFAVVDDLETSRDYMTMMLKNEGHEVDTFHSGADILRIAANLKQYSAIIIDVHMPGLSGYELADILQAMLGDACPALIFISASIESLNERKGQYNHSDQAFAKPINKDRFINAIQIVASDNIQPSAAKQKINVLVVEDEPINAEVIKSMLGKMGHRVYYAATAKEGVNLAISKDIDIILMDINLPDFSGIDATKIILNEYKVNVPIIALTANSFEEDRLASKQAGMRNHLIKPVPFDELEDVVQTAALK